MKDFAGRTAFITGGAQGIGLGIARRLAREGVNLALVDIDTEALKRARAELEGQTKVRTEVLDVRDREAFARVADAIEAAMGPVSLLFNNAGVAGAISIDKMNYAAWDWVLGINLQGVVNGIQTFLPRMIKRGAGGHIVNTSSGAGILAAGSGFLYATSKFAVVGMSESLHFELKQSKANIGLSVLCPGPVNTGIVGRSLEATPGFVAPTNPEAIQQIETIKAFLASGVSIDEVGDMVLRGIQEDALYIFTDRLIADGVKQRSEAILAALPRDSGGRRS
jgi:NAD(P)-dependent dehydrogenase (short-subunit alcohol dehydrogenase family)